MDVNDTKNRSQLILDQHETACAQSERLIDQLASGVLPPSIQRSPTT